jgi:hypothetical protein
MKLDAQAPSLLPAEPVRTPGSAENVAAASPPTAASQIISLQRSHGNRHVQRLVNGKADQADWKKFWVTVPAGPGTQLQFLRYAEVQIFGRVIDLQWDTSKEAAVHEPSKHVGKAILFKVRPAVLARYGVARPTGAEKAAADAEYRELDLDTKDAINAETDRRYYESTKDDPDSKIKAGEKGKVVIWNSLRDEVLGDRRRLAQLPETVRALVGADNLTLEHAQVLAQIAEVLSHLSADELKRFFVVRPNGAALSPDDFSRLLLVARKLVALSPEERQDYLERVNASTASLVDLQRAIDRYGRLREERARQSDEHNAAAKPLLGSDDLYTAYRNYRAWKKVVESAPEDDRSNAFLEKMWEWEDKLNAALALKDFKSVEAFEAALTSYRLAFRRQAVNLAFDVLDHYDHMLFAEQNKLEQGAAAGIAQGIAATQAPAHYKEYRRQTNIAAALRFGGSEYDDMASMEPSIEADIAADSARKQGEAEVLRGAGDHPLIAQHSIDLEKLAGLDAAGVNSYLMAEIRKRQAEVAASRKEFQEDPDRVFGPKMQDLVAATQKLLSIDATSVYGRSINDYISDEASHHLLSELALGALALALAFLVPVGGWLAAAALVGQAGISSYQAYTAYKEYREQERDYELGFLSEEPSLFWVGLAVAGAALDLGVTTTVLVKQSAKALKGLKVPLLEFSQDGNLNKLVEEVEAAKGLDTKLKEALEREAKLSRDKPGFERKLAEAAGAGAAGASGVRYGLVETVEGVNVRRAMSDLELAKIDAPLGEPLPGLEGFLEEGLYAVDHSEASLGALRLLEAEKVLGKKGDLWFSPSRALAEKYAHDFDGLIRAVKKVVDSY